jgi:hypothetical protein
MLLARRAIFVLAGLAVAGLAVGVTKLATPTADAARSGDATLSASEPNPSDPPAKSAVLATTQDLEGDIGNPPTADVMSAFADAGDPAQIAAVKAQLPDRLTADRATFRFPLDEQAIGDRLGDPLKATWAQVAQATQYQEKYEALKLELSEVGYRPYDDNRFVVDQWQGVRISGADAFALLQGHDEYLDESTGWSADPVRQWQVNLHLEQGSWKLVDQKSVGGGAP